MYHSFVLLVMKPHDVDNLLYNLHLVDAFVFAFRNLSIVQYIPSSNQTRDYYLISEPFPFLQTFSGLAILQDYLAVDSAFEPKKTFYKRAGLGLELATKLGTTAYNLPKIKVNEKTGRESI